MKEVLKYVAYLVGAVLLATALSHPYFQPRQAWPDWLILVAFICVVIGLIITSGSTQKDPGQVIREWEHCRRRVLGAEKRAADLQRRHSIATGNRDDPFAESIEHLEVEMRLCWQDIRKDFQRYVQMMPGWVDHEFPTLYRWAQSQHLRAAANQLRNESA